MKMEDSSELSSLTAKVFWVWNSVQSAFFARLLLTGLSPASLRLRISLKPTTEQALRQTTRAL